MERKEWQGRQMLYRTRGVSVGNFSVELLKHSRSRVTGLQAITYLVTYERFIHAEVMTHRAFSRNFSSSRAIPYYKMQEWIARDLALPLHYGSNKPGMQSGAEVDNPESMKTWLTAMYMNTSMDCDKLIREYDPHKEIVNRYTEPWGWITGIITTGWPGLANFFNLRISSKAHPNIQRLAVTMARLYRQSEPQILEPGQWHLPFIDSVQGTDSNLVWSVARAAWCSYNNPTKDATDANALKRHDDCVKFKHCTPLEHQLCDRGDYQKTGTVPGYDSYRSMVPGESASDFDLSILDREYAGVDFLADL